MRLASAAAGSSALAKAKWVDSSADGSQTIVQASDDGTLVASEDALAALDARIQQMVSDSGLTNSVAITVTDEALAWIAKNGYDPAYGARPIKRLIEDKVKQPMADELIHGKLQKGGQVTIGVKDDKLDFTFASRK